MTNAEHLTKWRLILGKDANAEQNDLSAEQQEMDNALSLLYEVREEEYEEEEQSSNGKKGAEGKKGGLEGSSVVVNRWLRDIRKYFNTSVVQVLQRDAMERLGLKQMLLEPELLQTLQPDVNLVATLVSLNHLMPEKTRETARMVVKKVVEEVEKKLRQPLINAIQGALSKSVKNRRPRSIAEIDWQTTIRANLRHYQADYKTIIPEKLHGKGRRGQSLKTVILLVDQSGSMSASMVYSAIFGAVMATIRSLRTHIVVFDTQVVDLTQELQDPIELLFCTQLGGGTDITKALTYSENLIQNPNETIILLISDLYEGNSNALLLRKAEEITQSGAKMISLLTLSNDGKPDYDKAIAQQFANIGIPAFACTPDHFPDLLAKAIVG